MTILFNNNLLEPKKVDPDYQLEYDAAIKVGYKVLLVSYEDIIDGDYLSAIDHIPTEGSEDYDALYRGWMLTVDQYEGLYKALLKNVGIELWNNPRQYKFCHHLPEWYESVKEITPKSVWFPYEDDFSIHLAKHHLTKLPKSVVLKDYVKSEKNYWNEACFIPDTQDEENLEKVVNRFLELRGDSLNEGLVFREFVDLAELQNHSKSDMPLTKEFRLFFSGYRVFAYSKYWEEGEYADLQPPIGLFEPFARKIESNFFTMDIALQKNGEWTIIELGDAQVSGLPEDINIEEFYKKLY